MSVRSLFHPPIKFLIPVKFPELSRAKGKYLYREFLKYALAMNLPPELEAQLTYLPSTEATEIQAFFANLSPYDQEIQNLILENLDLLLNVLTSQTSNWAASNQ